jgi:hypothetical protein
MLASTRFAGVGVPDRGTALRQSGRLVAAMINKRRLVRSDMDHRKKAGCPTPRSCRKIAITLKTTCFSFSLAESPAEPLGLRTVTFRQEAVAALLGLVEQSRIFV